MSEIIEMDASEALLELVFIAADHGMNSLNPLRPGGSFTPFVMSQDGQEQKLIRFSADLLEEGLSKAREYVLHNRSTIVAYCIAYDGYVTLKGERYDAVLVEAGEIGYASAYIFAQRYKPNADADVNDPVGNLAFLGKTPSRLVA